MDSREDRVMSEEQPVRYERRGGIAVVTMDRPDYRNAQNSAMTYALDAAYYRAVDDDEVKVIVLAGEGKHFSAGHDIGTPGRDIDQSFERKATLWWDHVGKEGGASRYARESEVYVGMCRRWREIPKPTIAMVQGACIAGGLMLAWSCDLGRRVLRRPGGADGDPRGGVLRASVADGAAVREGVPVPR
jgi:enoyl-CoA hydratase